MATSKAKTKQTKEEPKAQTNTGWQPTFRAYLSMNEGEQAAFRQGAKTVENKVKANLGFTKPKDAA